MTPPASHPNSPEHRRLLDLLAQVLPDAPTDGYPRGREGRRCLAGEVLADLTREGFDIVVRK